MADRLCQGGRYRCCIDSAETADGVWRRHFDFLDARDPIEILGLCT
jgi:16S rRNA C967 or C1407 C5-methylase (RsmB/RsmF family)